MCLLLHLTTEKDPLSETCSLVPKYNSMDKIQNPVVLNVVHHRQNPLESVTEVLFYFAYGVCHCDADIAHNVEVSLYCGGWSNAISSFYHRTYQQLK
jgi:hypothetical protein